MIHTRKDAEFLLFFLQKTIDENAKLIGSFGKGKEESEHDIDILLPSPNGFFRKRYWTIDFANYMKELLNAKSFEKTDWGGWYFHNTFFGDIDIFFTEKEFDY